MKRILFLIGTMVFFLSCASGPLPVVERAPLNKDNAPVTELATLNIDKFINVVTIDGEKVIWKNPSQSIRQQTVKISSGAHTFTLNYNDGNKYSTSPITSIANFEKGKVYNLYAMVFGNSLKITVYDIEAQKDVTLDMNKIQGNDTSTISTYIKFVLNPTMDTINKSVKLENAEFILIFKPDMIYTIENKQTGKITEGRRGFVMDFSMTKGTNYLLETDIKTMTRDDFLNKSNYQEIAQTVMTVSKCTDKEVTFLYEKPETLKGKEVVFSITELK